MTETQDLVDSILEAARRRPGKDLVSNIDAVNMEVTLRLMEIMEQYRQSERERVEDTDQWEAHWEKVEEKGESNP